MRTSTVLLSGGIDSMVCLDFVIETKRYVDAVYIDYGQISRTYELEAAKKISNHFNIELRLITLDFGKQFGVGEIPNRNAALIFSAAVAISGSSDELILGIHAGTEYKDCTAGFVKACKCVLEYSQYSQPSLIAPLQTWSKDNVFAYCITKNLPIAKTYSCEAGTLLPCGKCLSCRDREELSC